MVGLELAVLALIALGIVGLIRGASGPDHSLGHRNLADCYVTTTGAWDAHASGCAVCGNETSNRAKPPTWGLKVVGVVAVEHPLAGVVGLDVELDGIHGDHVDGTPAATDTWGQPRLRDRGIGRCVVVHVTRGFG